MTNLRQQKSDAEIDELISQWRAEAPALGPDPCAWATLVATLRLVCLKEPSNPPDPRVPEGMFSSIAATHALFTFLNAHKFVGDEKLLVPIYRILAAMQDVLDGRKPKLFTPLIKAQNRKTATAANVQAIAARALDELVAAGEEQKAAAQKVARAARAGRVTGFSRITHAKISNWRYRLREGAGEISELALDRYRAPLPPEAGDTPASRGAWLVAMLRDSPALRFG